MSLFALRCGVQEYAWGSTTLMAERFGWPDTDRPQAELWIGAHPLMPSAVFIDGEWSALDALIAEDPQRWIGTRATKRFGPTLPMLMKVLAIDQPLSL